MYTILFMHYPDDDTIFPTMATKLWDTKEEATKSMENIAKIMAIGPEAKYKISGKYDRIQVFNKDRTIVKMCIYKIPEHNSMDKKIGCRHRDIAIQCTNPITYDVNYVLTVHD